MRKTIATATLALAVTTAQPAPAQADPLRCGNHRYQEMRRMPGIMRHNHCQNALPARRKFGGAIQLFLRVSPRCRTWSQVVYMIHDGFGILHVTHVYRKYPVVVFNRCTGRYERR